MYLQTLDRFASFFDQAVIVLPESWIEQVRAQVDPLPYSEKLILQAGGDKRQDSVHRGLNRLSEKVEIVLVHDAVRPFVSGALIGRVIEHTRVHAACIPVIAVPDTIKELQGDQVVRTLDRDNLSLVQTPQGFKASLLRQAFERAARDEFYGTDEASLVERLGSTVHVVRGERTNIKVTWRENLKGR